MVSDPGSQEAFAKRWNGPSFWAPALGRRGGVAILCSPRQSDNVSVWQKDTGRRLLSILISLQNLKINLVNIYAPTKPTERKNFFQSISSFVFPNSRLIIAGDFNSYASALDKMGGSVSIDAHFSELKSVNSLKDAWRYKHPREKQFTWFNSDLSIASRLNYFLISRYLCAQAVSCEIRPCVYSDHEFVYLEFNLQMTTPRGPGIWKFNNSLLQDEKFCSAISDLITQFLRFRSSFPSDSILWDQLKQEIKWFTIKYSLSRCRQLSLERILITNRLIFLKRCLAAGCTFAKNEIIKLETQLSQLLDQQLEGAKIRSRAKWLEEGETPSRYFLHLENERHAKAFVSSIYDPSGTEVFSLTEIINAHTAFYTELFSCGNVNLDSQQNLFSYVTARLSDSDRTACEGPLTLAEATEALRWANRNKSPGADSLSVEFYSHFWDSLGEVLVAVFNQGLQNRELPNSMKASITQLVHKKDDKRNLKNWRPISLLNVDYKICAKAVSIRLAKVLGSIVDPDQTCSIPGRTIFSNLALLRDTLAFIERKNETGILLSLDQEKAFDRVDRSFLSNLLQHFGFGQWFQACIATLYKGAYTQILVNDFLTEPIYLARGVRQGDALSLMLYTCFALKC